ncbi:CK1 protein kinase [Aphelenchoides besseyi]|nr:CK1 protein kinase [Aphelenchoides besseyi]
MDKIGDLISTDTLLRRRYFVIRRLGSYGQVFVGRKVCDTEHMVAVKAEKRFRKLTDTDPRRMIIEQKPHIPVIYASGKTKTKRPYIVMSLLGPSLWDVQLEQPNKHFSLRTTIRVSQQILCGLQYLHEKRSTECVHRRFWFVFFPLPGRLCIPGMCRRFVLFNGQKRPPRKQTVIRCTYRYASIRMHERKESGPADDIESWLYAMVEMHKGKLPWKSLDDCDQIYKMKKKTNVTDLTAGMPDPFLKSWYYVSQLKWDDTPDYDHIHLLWRSCLKSLDEYKKKLDWELTGGYVFIK